MRLRKRGFVMLGTTMAVGALLGACTPEPPQTGSTPASTPTPSASTQTESPVEREQRLDFEAAEKAYRAATAEQSRLYRRGGAQKATAALKETATGEYLAFSVRQLRSVKKQRLKITGRLVIVGIERTAWKDGSVILTSCEDGSSTKVIDKAGHDVRPKGPALGVQELTVVKQKQRWLVSDVESTLVKTFEGRPCAIE